MQNNIVEDNLVKFEPNSNNLYEKNISVYNNLLSFVLNMNINFFYVFLHMKLAIF